MIGVCIEQVITLKVVITHFAHTLLLACWTSKHLLSSRKSKTKPINGVKFMKCTQKDNKDSRLYYRQCIVPVEALQVVAKGHTRI